MWCLVVSIGELRLFRPILNEFNKVPVADQLVAFADTDVVQADLWSRCFKVLNMPNEGTTIREAPETKTLMYRVIHNKRQIATGCETQMINL